MSHLRRHLKKIQTTITQFIFQARQSLSNGSRTRRTNIIDGITNARHRIVLPHLRMQLIQFQLSMRNSARTSMQVLENAKPIRPGVLIDVERSTINSY